MSTTVETETNKTSATHKKQSQSDQANSIWTEEEVSMLKRLHSAKKSVEDMQKVRMQCLLVTAC